MPVFKVSVHGTLGMIGSVLYAFDDARFERLIVLGKLP